MSASILKDDKNISKLRIESLNESNELIPSDEKIQEAAVPKKSRLLSSSSEDKRSSKQSTNRNSGRSEDAPDNEQLTMFRKFLI